MILTKIKMEKNIRVPVKLSYNSIFVDPAKNPRGGINKFMDGTDIPTGLGEQHHLPFLPSGTRKWVNVFMAIRNLNIKGKVDPYTHPNQVIDPVKGLTFITLIILIADPFSGAGMLWNSSSMGPQQLYNREHFPSAN